MFLNFTNHNNKDWSNKQLEHAKKYGEIVFLHFPEVDPCASSEDIIQIADFWVTQIKKMSPAIVLCQGEMTLTFAIVTRLKACNIKVVSATSKRVVSECLNDLGNTVKTYLYEFISFREYI